MRTAFTAMVGVEHPLAGFNRSPGVVAAVTNAGGLGVLAASWYSPEELDPLAPQHALEADLPGVVNFL
jgi:uncharacterized protein (DUF2342 family)